MLSNDAFAQQAYLYPRVQQGYHNIPAQQSYPAHQPVHTWPQTPVLNAMPTPAGLAQQHTPANSEAAPKPVPRKRKGEDEKEHKDGQVDQPTKKKSRSEKGIETKKRKAEDEEYRRYLRKHRDTAIYRLSELGQRLIYDAAERAEFDQLINSLANRNLEIDNTTEDHIEYYSMRPEKRPEARPAKKHYDD